MSWQYEHLFDERYDHDARLPDGRKLRLLSRGDGWFWIAAVPQLALPGEKQAEGIYLGHAVARRDLSRTIEEHFQADVYHLYWGHTEPFSEWAFCKENPFAANAAKELIRRERVAAEEAAKIPSVYFIQSAQGGPIKIGYSGNVKRRVKELQTSGAHEFVVLLKIPGTRQDETRFHRRFKAHRIDREWFNPSEELLVFIKESSVV